MKKEYSGKTKSKGGKKNKLEKHRCTCLEFNCGKGRIVEKSDLGLEYTSLECLLKPIRESHGKFVSRGMYSELCFRKINLVTTHYTD